MYNYEMETITVSVVLDVTISRFKPQPQYALHTRTIIRNSSANTWCEDNSMTWYNYITSVFIDETPTHVNSESLSTMLIRYLNFLKLVEWNIKILRQMASDRIQIGSIGISLLSSHYVQHSSLVPLIIYTSHSPPAWHCPVYSAYPACLKIERNPDIDVSSRQPWP